MSENFSELSRIIKLECVTKGSTQQFLKINQSAKVRTFNRVETLNLFVTRTKAYSNSDVQQFLPEGGGIRVHPRCCCLFPVCAEQFLQLREGKLAKEHREGIHLEQHHDA